MATKPNRRTWLYVVSLDPERATHKKVRMRNPKGHKGRPCVYVGVSGVEPAKLFSGRGFTDGPKEVQRYGKRLLSRYTCYRYKRFNAVKEKFRLIAELRSKGYWVYNDNEALTHCVYVVLLKPELKTNPRVTGLNPEARKRKPCVYVGQTGRTPQERLKQHKRGELANRWVRDYGIRLMPDLYEHLNPINELQSLRMERRLAKKLRRKGYTVLGGT